MLAKKSREITRKSRTTRRRQHEGKRRRSRRKLAQVDNRGDNEG